MQQVATKAGLTPARQRLVELMQEANYGRISDLQVLDGDPVLDPPPVIERKFVFGKQNGPNPARSSDSFALKKHVVELFELFEQEQSLSITDLVINDGLPVEMIWTETTRA